MATRKPITATTATLLALAIGTAAGWFIVILEIAAVFMLAVDGKNSAFARVVFSLIDTPSRLVAGNADRAFIVGPFLWGLGVFFIAFLVLMYRTMPIPDDD